MLLSNALSGFILECCGVFMNRAVISYTETYCCWTDYLKRIFYLHIDTHYWRHDIMWEVLFNVYKIIEKIYQPHIVNLSSWWNVEPMVSSKRQHGLFRSTFLLINSVKLSDRIQHHVHMLSQATFFAAEYYEQASKRPYGPFGAKPDMLSVFISIVKLLDAEALARFAMPTRASVFNSIFLYFWRMPMILWASLSTRGLQRRMVSVY